MGVNDWRDIFVGDNVRLVRPWNEAAAVAALRLVKSLDKVPHATGE